MVADSSRCPEVFCINNTRFMYIIYGSGFRASETNSYSQPVFDNGDMRHVLLLTGLIFLSICWVPVEQMAQAKPQFQARRQSEKVDTLIQEIMSARHIPGLSLALVREGKVILARGYGVANLELSVPATEKTNFPIYSITKSFTAIATMMLVEDGKISLDDPISKHLSGISPAGSAVTIRQLLNHTSGIRNYQDRPPEPDEELTDDTLPSYTKWVADITLVSPPGERWDYQDTGYYLLGRLIEKVSGKPYEQFLRERIFRPLGMNETHLLTFDELIPNRAAGYSWRDGAFRNARQVKLATQLGNSGLVSTVIDMAKWDASLYTDKLLKPASLDQMWTNATLKNGQIVSSYGLGFGLTPFRGRRRVGHTGGGPGFVSAYSRFIDDKVTVIVLANADQEEIRIGEIANEIASLFLTQRPKGQGGN